MKLVSSLLVIAVVSSAAVLPASAKIERTVEKTFVVNGSGTIRLETSGGAIRVTPGGEGQIKITAKQRISAESDAEADELLKRLTLEFDQTGNDVRGTARYEKQSPGFHFGSWPPVQVDFVAIVPAAYASVVRTSGGSITIGDLTGRVEARTSGGAITLGKLGGEVEARTSGGSITLDQSAGETKLDTSGGPITVGRIAGSADLSTSGGSIRVDAVEGALKAHTSGGSIRAAIVGPLTGDSSLTTSGGTVHVTVDKAAAFKLDASTSGGGVEADGLAIALAGGEHKRGKLVGDVNGGGKQLKLHSSGGGIHIAVQ